MKLEIDFVMSSTIWIQHGMPTKLNLRSSKGKEAIGTLQIKANFVKNIYVVWKIKLGVIFAQVRNRVPIFTFCLLTHNRDAGNNFWQIRDERKLSITKERKTKVNISSFFQALLSQFTWWWLTTLKMTDWNYVQKSLLIK